jgi:GNAT superfamily N-acetyltransferase
MRFPHAHNDKAEYGLHALMAYDDEGRAIGLLHYVLHPVAGCVHPICYLQDVYVRVQNRRQGVGSALLNHLQAIADQQSWDRIYWFVDERNEDAKAFYEGRSVTVDFKLHFLPVRLMREQGLS